jgi:hypothetical protein
VAGHGQVSSKEESIVPQDLADILTGFVDRRKGSVPINDTLPGVIGRERQWKVAAESVEQLA